MGRIESYRDLDVWRRGMEIVACVYEATGSFPRDEQYNLTSQLRRASASIPSNIAEGWGYHSRTRYVHYLKQARASIFEVETQLLIAENLGYIDEPTKKKVFTQTDVESRMLLTLIRSLES
jgi:four helix bundle protein